MHGRLILAQVPNVTTLCVFFADKSADGNQAFAGLTDQKTGHHGAFI